MTEAEALEAHVAVCPQCEKRLETADDLGRVVAEAYRQGPLAEDQIVAESEFRQAVEAVQQLPGGSPADATRDYPNSEPRIGQVIAGRYKLLEQIGEGGMGAVYMAQQTEPVKRLVALKVIIAGMDSKAVLARFEAERQALAMMDHPNIARVLDAGAMENGRPFFVMELVKGVPITRFCDERRLTLRQRLELFVPVCQAIQHAHQKGIIHRDIKPSNVLVAMYDDRPVPKVIDFGLAKATGQALTDKTLVTAFGAAGHRAVHVSRAGQPEQPGHRHAQRRLRAGRVALRTAYGRHAAGPRRGEARRGLGSAADGARGGASATQREAEQFGSPAEHRRESEHRSGKARAAGARRARLGGAEGAGKGPHAALRNGQRPGPRRAAIFVGRDCGSPAAQALGIGCGNSCVGTRAR